MLLVAASMMLTGTVPVRYDCSTVKPSGRRTQTIRAFGQARVASSRLPHVKPAAGKQGKIVRHDEWGSGRAARRNWRKGGKAAQVQIRLDLFNY